MSGSERNVHRKHKQAGYISGGLILSLQILHFTKGSDRTQRLPFVRFQCPNRIRPQSNCEGRIIVDGRLQSQICMELKIQNIHENSSQKLNIKKSSPVQSSGWMDGWMETKKENSLYTCNVPLQYRGKNVTQGLNFLSPSRLDLLKPPLSAFCTHPLFCCFAGLQSCLELLLWAPLHCN